MPKIVSPSNNTALPPLPPPCFGHLSANINSKFVSLKFPVSQNVSDKSVKKANILLTV